MHVPVGRPPEGNPPFSWEESATDYLKMEFLGKSTSWGVAQMLEQFERSNEFSISMVMHKSLYQGTVCCGRKILPNRRRPILRSSRHAQKVGGEGLDQF
jgi:lysozyme family protein